jgi:hypothetical protein
MTRSGTRRLLNVPRQDQGTPTELPAPLDSETEAFPPSPISYLLIEPDGTVAAVHVRIDYPAGKEFRWQQPDGKPGLGGRRSASLPLYRLPMLSVQPDAVVYVCEGEKATDALVEAGYCAVGTTTGANTIPDTEVLAVLAGRNVALWPDNDDVGAKHMDGIAERLDGVAASIAFVEWPDAPDQGDAADFLQMFPPSAVTTVPQVPYQPRPARPRDAPRRGAVTLAEFLAAEDRVGWALPGGLPRGGFVMAVGSPESFKTQGALTLALAFAGAIRDFLGVKPSEWMPVLYVSNEKSGAMVRARLRTMVAGDRTPSLPFLVLHRQGVHFGTESWKVVRETLAELGRPALVILDTLASLAPPGFDENSGKDMSIVLDDIREIQRDYGATVVLLHHPSKYGQGPAGARARGHTSLWGEVDAVWLYERPDRSSPCGLLKFDVKDADQQLIPFRWDKDTFLLQRDISPDLKPSAVATVVASLWVGEGIKSAQIAKAFAPRHRRSAVMARLSKAVHDGLVEKQGDGNATLYYPPDHSPEADERHTGLDGEPADG